MPLALSIVQNGRFVHFFGHASELDPINLLPQAKNFPPFVWLLHGRQDSAVPFEETEYFVEELKKHARGTVVRFDERDGEHGFDLDARLSDAWMEGGVQEVLSRW
jgi:2-polyprenyl-6-methoxyphenol hydroxylase-like FAD-dependent oxidoreductase